MKPCVYRMPDRTHAAGANTAACQTSWRRCSWVSLADHPVPHLSQLVTLQDAVLVLSCKMVPERAPQARKVRIWGALARAGCSVRPRTAAHPHLSPLTAKQLRVQLAPGGPVQGIYSPRQTPPPCVATYMILRSFGSNVTLATAPNGSVMKRFHVFPASALIHNPCVFDPT